MLNETGVAGIGVSVKDLSSTTGWSPQSTTRNVRQVVKHIHRYFRPLHDGQRQHDAFRAFAEGAEKFARLPRHMQQKVFAAAMDEH